MSRTRKGQQFQDNFDVLQDDVNNIVVDAQEDAAERTKYMSVLQAPCYGGVVNGMTLTSPLAEKLTIAQGRGYTNDGTEIVVTDAITLDCTNPTDLNKYIIVSVTIEDDTDYNRQNPITGVVEATRVKSTVTGSLSSSISGGLVTNTSICLGRISDWDTVNNKPLFGVAGFLSLTGTIGSVDIYGKSGSAAVRGKASGKYYVMIKYEEGGSLSCVESTNAMLSVTAGYHYLTITVPTLLGVPICTLGEIETAVNLLTYFMAETSNPSSILTSGLINQFYPLLTGNDYRQLYQTKSGSKSLTDADTFFPENDDYTKHIASIGNGTPAANNPHGLTIEDVGYTGVDLQNHKLYEHVLKSAIRKESDVDYLKTTINNTTHKITISGQTATTDMAVINGKEVSNIVNANTGVDYAFTPSADTEPSRSSLYELYVTSSGTAYQKKIAQFPLGSTLVNVAGNPVVFITDKHPQLTGSKTLTIVQSGGGTVMTATFGSGATVNITTAHTNYKLFADDGYWIEVQRSDYMSSDATVSETITLVESETNELLSTSKVWYHGNNSDLIGYFVGASLIGYKDSRIWGTHSDENIQNDCSKKLYGKQVRYDDDYLLASGTSGTTAKLSPFEVDFNGQTYKIPAQDITATSTKYIIIRFSDYKDSSLRYTITTIANLTSYIKETDILLGYVYVSGGNISRTSSFFPKQTEIDAKNEIILQIGDGGWNVDEALTFAQIMQDDTIGTNTSIVFELLSDCTANNFYKTMRKLIIRGNGFTLNGIGAGSGSGILVGTTITADYIYCENITLKGMLFSGKDTNTQDDFIFKNVKIQGTTGHFYISDIDHSFIYPHPHTTSNKITNIIFDNVDLDISGTTGIYSFIQPTGSGSVLYSLNINILNSRINSTSENIYLLKKSATFNNPLTVVELNINNNKIENVINEISLYIYRINVNNNYWYNSVEAAPIFKITDVDAGGVIKLNMKNNQRMYGTGTNIIEIDQSAAITLDMEITDNTIESYNTSYGALIENISATADVLDGIITVNNNRFSYTGNSSASDYFQCIRNIINNQYNLTFNANNNYIKCSNGYTDIVRGGFSSLKKIFIDGVTIDNCNIVTALVAEESVIAKNIVCADTMNGSAITTLNLFTFGAKDIVVDNIHNAGHIYASAEADGKVIVQNCDGECASTATGTAFINIGIWALTTPNVVVKNNYAVLDDAALYIADTNSTNATNTCLCAFGNMSKGGMGVAGAENGNVDVGTPHWALAKGNYRIV